MKKELLFTIDALPYRQPIPVYGYRFGSEEKTLAVMGAIRGDEFQQMYTAARLGKRLADIEGKGLLQNDCGILVVPCAGQFSMNVGHRFWPLDNTDINRMFPGYDAGETTQRLADRIFANLKGYKWGVHLTSLYLPGDFVPHLRIMDTGLQKNEEGGDFGLPYLVVRKPRPYDTTTLNYNWQLWGTHTFSLYTRATDSIDEESAGTAVESIIRFLVRRGLIHYTDFPPGEITQRFDEQSLVTIHNDFSGILLRVREPADTVGRGDVLARIIDPYTAEIREKIVAPCDGEIFFARRAQILSEHTIVFRLIV